MEFSKDELIIIKNWYSVTASNSETDDEEDDLYMRIVDMTNGS